MHWGSWHDIHAVTFHAGTSTCIAYGLQVVGASLRSDSERSVSLQCCAAVSHACHWHWAILLTGVHMLPYYIALHTAV
jgi:hypothetical protein